MTISDTIKQELIVAREVLDNFLSNPSNIVAIEKAGNLMAKSINQGGKIISCGNGGSCCDAMHFAEELTGRYRENRKPIAAISIADPSHMSCVSNDFGYPFIFSRYIEALGKNDDVLLAISTSGNSENIINAAIEAKKLGIKVVSLTGKDGGKLSKHSDIEIRVPYMGYADRIQEIHIKIIHILMVIIENNVH